MIALKDQLWAEYRTAVDNGWPTAALAAIECLHQLEPQNTFYGYIRGKSLRIVGRCKEAERLLLEAHADFWGKEIQSVEMALGDVFRATNRPLEAEKWYRRAVASAPNTTGPYVFLAGFLASQERFSEACKVLEQATGASGELDEVHLNLALNWRALGDFERARAEALKAIQITPDYEAAQRTLADIESAIRMREQYEIQVRRALREE